MFTRKASERVEKLHVLIGLFGKLNRELSWSKNFMQQKRLRYTHFLKRINEESNIPNWPERGTKSVKWKQNCTRHLLAQ